LPDRGEDDIGDGHGDRECGQDDRGGIAAPGGHCVFAGLPLLERTDARGQFAVRDPVGLEFEALLEFEFQRGIGDGHAASSAPASPLTRS
jgi:hypothetical protein